MSKVDRIWVDIDDCGAKDIDIKPYDGATKFIRSTPTREAADELLAALKLVAPDEPMNQDEQGGCVWCGGSKKGHMYAGADPKDHDADCPWVIARAALHKAEGRA